MAAESQYLTTARRRSEDEDALNDEIHWYRFRLWIQGRRVWIGLRKSWSIRLWVGWRVRIGHNVGRSSGQAAQM
jgi:hypothetical protein